MWELGNQGIIVLVSVISGCVILCNVWGSFLALTISLFIVICAWWTFHAVDQTPFTPHVLLALDYLEEAGREINSFLENVYVHLYGYSVYLGNVVGHFYRVGVVARMAQRRRSTYQLSTESYPNSRNSARFSLVEGLSPIPRGVNSFASGAYSNVENSPYVEANSRGFERDSVSKVTSTPLVPWKREDAKNGDIFGAKGSSSDGSVWKKSPLVTQNRSPTRGEDTSYSPEGSPWGTSISPKMRARAGGVKTVQTVAGPLLASTRYNIDPKVYSDITSPGLTTRLTKYATEANTKLTHQSQYGTGQFPRVNLNSIPTPMINAKTGKMRMPVTVRVAPPENTRYSPPERQKILSDICHAEAKTPPSVVQVLREISLKRHASRDDVSIELAKKQRTESVFSDGLENLEEMTQKRGRDESSKSEEEISPQNKSIRPAKRSKMPSCYDIISSLSSSINVSSGVKRKAIDISRSGTPDAGKHFKSLDSSHGDGVRPIVSSRSVVETTKPNKRSLNETDTSRNSDVFAPLKKSCETILQKGILKSPSGKEVLNQRSGDVREKHHDVEEQDVRIVKEIPTALQHVPVKLTDKLFMKAEPQNIDKLKTLIEEHGSIKPRFMTNDVDEIKKSDIVNMRQTSMKTRLKSMFDAISGKAPSKINPEVVIQAEEAKAPTSSSSLASLSSSTSTTNVNTSPIATSAIVPIIGKTKPSTTPAKHVTFQFTRAESSAKTDSSVSSNHPTTETRVTSSVSEPKESKKIENSDVVEKSVAASSIFQSFDPPIAATSAPAPTFSFGSPSMKTSSIPTVTCSITTPVANSTSPTSLTSTPATIATTTPPQVIPCQLFNMTSSAVTQFRNSMSTVAKSNVTTLPNFNTTMSVAEKTSQPLANFSFGTSATSSTTPANSQNESLMSTQSTLTSGNQSFAAKSTAPATTATSNLFGTSNSMTSSPPAFSSTMSNSFVSSAATTGTTSMFSFGTNAAPQTAEKKGFTFRTEESSSVSTVGNSATNPTVSTSLAPTTTATGGFSFSSNNAPTSSTNNLFGAPTTTSSTSGSGFAPSGSTAPAFAFGSNTNTTATSKPGGFPFGVNSTTAAIVTKSAPVAASISFGATNNTSTSLFGAPSTTASASTAITAQPSLFGTPATSAVAFPTTTTSSSFGPTSTQPSFLGNLNTSNNTYGSPKTMESPAFGAKTSVAPPSFSSSSTASSLFSSANTSASSNPTPATAAPAFGSSTFGQTKTAFASTGATSLFGPQPSTTSSFGTANPVTNAAIPIFGSSSTPAQSFGTPSTAPPAFGATNTATPTFGTQTTAVPSFGSQTSTAGTSGNQNSTTPAFNATGSTFGAVTTAPPAFGSSISGFRGSTSSSFGTPSNPPPAFGSTSSSFAGFGSSSNTASPFGTPQTPGTSTFGTPNSATPAFGSNNSANSSFTFGGSQPTPTPQPQQNQVFAFGNSSATPTNNAPSGSTPFQFGSSAPQPGGFNFSGAPSNPAINFSKDGTPGGSFSVPAPGANAFNAPTTGGMFSIGTGSTAPRTRTSRRRNR